MSAPDTRRPAGLAPALRTLPAALFAAGAALAGGPGAADAQTADTVWTATLTTGASSTAPTLFGYTNNPGWLAGGALSEDEFSYTFADTARTIRITRVTNDNADGGTLAQLNFGDADGIAVFRNPNASARLTLWIGTARFEYGRQSSSSNHLWYPSGLTWSAGQMIDVMITVANEPRVHSIRLTSDPGSDDAYAAGDVIVATVDFIEELDVSGSPQLELQVGANPRTASCAASTDNRKLECSYTVVSADEDTDGVSIAENKLTLNGATIKSTTDTATAVLAHRAVAAAARHRVGEQATPPTVDSLTLSDAGPDGAYAIGDSVSVTVAFSDSVDVTGTPQLDIDVAGSAETLSYDSGTGTDSLLFTGYVVAENDADVDGIEIAENALTLNGGTIRLKGSTTVNATITHDSVAADAAHRVDGVRPTLVTAATTGDGKKVTLTFSEALSSTTAPASAFTVTVDGSARDVNSVFAGGGPGVTLVLASAVTVGQTVTVGYTDPTANDDAEAVQDQAGNDAATFTAQTVTNNARAGTEGEVLWSVDMNVGVSAYTIAPVTIRSVGYYALFGLGSISGSAAFSYGGTSYTVGSLALAKETSGSVVVTDNLEFHLSPLFPIAPADQLILALDGTEFRFNDATRNTDDPTHYLWATPGLTWGDGETVAAKLIAVAPPSVASVAVTDAPSDDIYAIADTIDLAVTFTKDVTLDVTDGTPELELMVGDSTRTATCAAASGTQLTCRYPVDEGIAGAITVAPNKLTLNGATLTGPIGLNADTTYTADEVDIDADLRVDGVRPTLVTSGADAPRTSADGWEVILTFSETLSRAGGRFTVTAGGTNNDVEDAAVNGVTIRLSLGNSIRSGQTVTVAYTDPSADDDASATQDLAGNDVATFSAQTVTNLVAGPAVESVALVDAGADGAYAIGDTVSVTVTFSDSVDVTGTPQLDIDVGGSNKTLSYDSGTGTRALVFARYIVAENDADTDGIAIAENALDLNGGTIRLKGSATVNATITHDSVAADAAHRVDGVRPTLVTTGAGAPRTSANGATIVLTFSETLFETTAAPGAFTVTVNGSARTVGAVSSSGAVVNLTLTSAVATGETVTVAYTDPSANDDAAAVQDAAGNDAATFSAQSVTNTLVSTDASLSALSLSDVTLAPAFHTDSLNYTATVANSVATTTVSATATHLSATIEYLDASDQALTDADAAAGFQVALAVGVNTIKVRVTAADGNTRRTYTAAVTRVPRVSVSLGAEDGEVKGEHSVMEGPLSGQTSHSVAVHIPIELSEPPGRSVSIPLTTTHGTGAGADDYDVCVSTASEAGGDCTTATEGYSASMPASITFAPDVTRMVIRLHPVDDAVVEGDETITVTVGTSLPGGVEQGEGSEVEVTIRDNDGLTGRFAGSAYRSRHHKGPGDRPQMVLEFSAAVDTIEVNTPSVQVTNASVVTAQAHTETGVTNGWILVLEPDGAETIKVRLVAGKACSDKGICSGGTMLQSVPPYSVSIPYLPPAMTVADAEATEGDDTAMTFTVKLDRPALTAITVDYATADGTAEAGMDYTARSGELAFAVGDTAQTISVAIIDDTVNDDGETFELLLSGADGARLVDSVAVGTIRNTEAQPLTASFSDMPDDHTGAEFTFGLTFSEEPKSGFSYATLRDHAFKVTGGDVTRAQRREQGKNTAWTITVEPGSANDTVKITLPETTDCSATGAICTSDDRKLSHSLSDTVAPAATSGDMVGGDAEDGALAILDGVTPEEASAALFGEGRLSDAQLEALDRLGNRNGSYDLGDLLSWTERCRSGEANCGGDPTGPGAASSIPLFGAAAGRRSSSGRRRRRPSRRRSTGTVLAVLLAVATGWSCAGDLAGPRAAEREPVPPPAPATAPKGPGFLAVEWAEPGAGSAIGVLLELEGPGIEAVQAPGLELYQSRAEGRHRVVVAGDLEAGPLLRFRVPDRGRLSLYRVRVLQVTGEDYSLRDAGEYRVVISPPVSRGHEGSARG
ncbi:MAG: hypothetical protein F4164_08955 [Gemmatimonadales bacterium]|nr:hypothetical protein [Gemmatimonadales bacterium]MYG49476.1 hypothetical protein [Gemmatimonadales bacterium]MYK01666.1 hypothetical protein [Candidatus Palauibacter ramosifaciens]